MRRALLPLVLALALCACEQSSAAGPDRKLVLTGSSTIAPLATEIAQRFEDLHPGVRVDVQSGGSGRGIADARSGAADIGMASRALDESESDLFATPIARDGVCMIVNRENPVPEISDGEVVRIYRGEIRGWKDVGGDDSPIVVVNKAEGRATLEVFLGYFHLKNAEIRADVVIGENEQGIKTVASNRDALGYVSIGTAEVDAENGVAIRLLPIGGVAASTEHVGDGSFPMSRPLNLVTRQDPATLGGLAREFLDFARSEAVHDIVVAQHFAPVRG